MNRRTLFKGLAVLPFLKHLDFEPVETAPIEEIANPNHWTSWQIEGVSLEPEPYREPCLSDEAYERILAKSGGWCAPMTVFYDLPTGDGRRPVRDSLPTFNLK